MNDGENVGDVGETSVNDGENVGETSVKNGDGKANCSTDTNTKTSTNTKTGTNTYTDTERKILSLSSKSIRQVFILQRR